MYPDSFFQWIGYIGVVFGVLIGLGLIIWVLFLDHHDDGNSSLRLLFETLSAIFVVISLLTAIYSDRVLLRGIAGVSLIALVSATTYSLLEGRPKDE